MLAEISSWADEACIAKGENAVYEGLADQHYGKHANKEKKGIYVWLQSGTKEIYFPSIGTLVFTH